MHRSITYASRLGRNASHMHQMGRNIWAATGYDRLSRHRVGASQQPQGTRVSRQLQDVTISAATECEYLGISLAVTTKLLGDMYR